MSKLIIGINDVATLYPHLVSEWDIELNNGKKPSEYTIGSHEKILWKMSYDDSITGKHFDFVWIASIKDRTISGNGCPYLSNSAVWKGFNDLATLKPDLAKEWHPTKNGDLKPTDVTIGSKRKVWWYLPYDDPKTGKHFDFEWEASINNRSSHNLGCPYLSGSSVWKGFNDLVTIYPTLSLEWHPTKNGSLNPTDVTANSEKKVWWYLPYDDPKTGKHFDFEWEAVIISRTKLNAKCPYITNNKVYKGYNDVATTNPELISEWDIELNNDKKPTEYIANSLEKIIWKKAYDDPKTEKHFDFIWSTPIRDRAVKKNGCPFISGKSVWKGYNDVATTNPELISEWDIELNNGKKPTEYTIGSHQKIIWKLPYDDPITKKHFDFVWQATIGSRKKLGCPYLSGRAIWQGFNDLATIRPDLAKEWHPTKNGNLQPTDVTVSSKKKVWWYLPYDDPKTGKHFDFEWETSVGNRTNGCCGCPYIKASKLEQLTYEILNKMNLDFIAEKKFKNCKDTNVLPFDVFIINSEIIIELDGIQHFRKIDTWGGEESFLNTQLHDKIKDDFCFKNNIPLLRIPYIYDAITDKAEISKIIKDFINNHTIPKKIQEFYKIEQRYSYINFFD